MTPSQKMDRTLKLLGLVAIPVTLIVVAATSVAAEVAGLPYWIRNLSLYLFSLSLSFLLLFSLVAIGVQMFGKPADWDEDDALLLGALSPECASAPLAARRRYVMRAGAAAFVFGTILFWPDLSDASAQAPALLQILTPFLVAFFIYEFSVLMRSLDELQFKLHMTAVAIAGGALAGGLTIWGLAEYFLGAPSLPTILAFPALALFYYLAISVVARRY